MATAAQTSASPPHSHSGVLSPVRGGWDAGCVPGVGIGVDVYKRQVL